MSEEQLKAFLEKVKGDTSLQEKLKAEGADPIAIAKAAGFLIETKDLLLFKEQRNKLTDADLETVAGGGLTGGETCELPYFPCTILQSCLGDFCW